MQRLILLLRKTEMDAFPAAAELSFPLWIGFAVTRNSMYIDFIFFFKKPLVCVAETDSAGEFFFFYHLDPDILETIICYQTAGSLRFVGSFRLSDSCRIPSSGDYWYCKPGPNTSSSSFALVVQSFLITVVSQYKIQSPKEHKCKPFWAVVPLEFHDFLHSLELNSFVVT